MRYRCTFDRDERGRTRTSLMREGERISGLAIWHMPMRVGGCEVLTGGIGGVWTHADHRNRGYASVVMAESVQRMEERGFDVSVLFGIADFYHRWGFITMLSGSTVGVPTRHAETARRTCRPRGLRPADLTRALRIYNRDNARRTGSILRRKSTWIPWRNGIRWGEKPDVFVYSAGGRTVGVAAFSLRRDAVDCCDLSAAGASAFGGILRHAADLAVERRVEAITFHLPPDHPFADFCREQGCELREQVPRAAGGMGRIIRQTQCLSKIAPELSRRLDESVLARWSGTLDVATDLETTRLVVKGGRVRVGKRAGRADVSLRLPQERLTQLLFGFQSIDFLLAHGLAKLTRKSATPAAQGVVDTLFPKGHPYVWLPDRF